MRVQRVAWIGMRTDRFEETKSFFRDLLGLPAVHEEADFTMLQLPSGERDYLEIFGAATGFEAENYSTGPVPGFLVSDLAEARRELATADIELLDEIHWPRSLPGYGWFHFRGPDGNVYAMVQGSEAGRT